ncbi:hypothetical protein [Massilia varians]|uniref:hypothetical protein n=1 Tax=Massilia varians TaxID=457921 RepID=UPI0025542C22|nr:hypothetical protein [Massilia varians]MDK6078652.1 hypothetical protein [Massilia varians]
MTKEQRWFLRSMGVGMFLILAALVVDSVSTSRHNIKMPPPIKVVRDGWMEAARQGAPIYGAEGGVLSLRPKPAGKRIELHANGYVFATDDLADVRRWYAVLSAPALDLSRFPAVRYVHEVEHVELVELDGREVLAITIHEARSGCVKPACDPVTELPNYDRRYVVTNPNGTIHIEGGGNA